MNEIITTIIDYFLKVREAVDSVLSPILPWLKFFALVLSAFLIWGIYYTIVGSGYVKRRYDELSDAFGIGHVGKRRQLRSWKKILKRMQSKDMTKWKVAILEADAIFDEILKMSGYRGNDVHERFKQLTPTAISNYDKIIIAHQIRDRVRQEADFIINQPDALAVIRIYGQAFKELGLIE